VKGLQLFSVPLEDRAPLVLALALATLFLALYVGPGLDAGLTDDDAMNLYFARQQNWGSLLWANAAYWSPAYRPLGAVVYRGVYAIWGFQPEPFRVLCHILIAVNVVLAFWAAWMLSDSAFTGALTGLLLSYNAGFSDLYRSTGTLYDLLCFAFLAAATGLYAQARREDRAPTPAVLLLWVLALNSKEIAVVLPAVLITYEVLWKRTRPPLLVWAAAGMAVPYVLGKLSSKSVLSTVDGYRVTLDIPACLENTGRYVGALLDPYSAPVHFAWLVVPAALAWILKSRTAAFGLLFMLAGAAPVACIPPRSGFAFYVPAFGLALTAAALVAAVWDRWLPRLGWVRLGAVFLAGLWIAGAQRVELSPHLSEADVRALAEALRGLPPPERGARIALVGGPFPEDNWTPVFVGQLVHPGVEIERHAVPPPQKQEPPRIVLVWTNGRWRRAD
jgi:hypothetical protein